MQADTKYKIKLDCIYLFTGQAVWVSGVSLCNRLHTVRNGNLENIEKRLSTHRTFFNGTRALPTADEMAAWQKQDRHLVFSADAAAPTQTHVVDCSMHFLLVALINSVYLPHEFRISITRPAEPHIVHGVGVLQKVRFHSSFGEVSEQATGIGERRSPGFI